MVNVLHGGQGMRMNCFVIAGEQRTLLFAWFTTTSSRRCLALASKCW